MEKLYIYAGDVYCNRCGEWLIHKLPTPTGPNFDSSDYPAGAYLPGDVDVPLVCAGCQALLGGSLTEEGIRYVRDLLEGYLVWDVGSDAYIYAVIEAYGEQLSSTNRAADELVRLSKLKAQHLLYS